jgi:hypothetical protein
MILSLSEWALNDNGNLDKELKRDMMPSTSIER